MGDNGTGETHFEVKIAAEELGVLSAVNAHRKINALLKDEFGLGLHALEIKISK
jgi:BolA protein